MCYCVCVGEGTERAGREAYPITSKCALMGWQHWHQGELQNFQSYLRTKESQPASSSDLADNSQAHWSVRRIVLEQRIQVLCLAGYKPQSAAMKAGWPWRAGPSSRASFSSLSSLWEGSHSGNKSQKPGHVSTLLPGMSCCIHSVLLRLKPLFRGFPGCSAYPHFPPRGDYSPQPASTLHHGPSDVFNTLTWTCFQVVSPLTLFLNLSLNSRWTAQGLFVVHSGFFINVC